MKPLSIHSRGNDANRAIDGCVAASTNASSDARGSMTLNLAGGRQLRLLPSSECEAADRISICAPSGNVEVEIRLTDQGPVITAQAARLNIESPEVVSVDCERFAVHATRQIDLASEGDITGRCAGRLDVHADNEAAIKGDSVVVRAEQGNIDLDANDDVCLTAERIYLNK